MDFFAYALPNHINIKYLWPGKIADLIILEKDPSEDISNIRSITHVMRGRLLQPVIKNAINKNYEHNYMKTIVSTLLICLFSYGNIIAQTSVSTKAVTAFTNAMVIDGIGAAPLENATVVVEGKRITCVGECEVPKGAKVFDAKGKYIIPGLVDAHVHYDGTASVDMRGWSPDLFPYKEVEADLREYPERFHRSYLCSGVTAVFDTGGPTWTLDIRDDAKGSTSAPHMAAAGPLLTTMPKLIEDPAARGVNFFMADEEAVRFGVRMLSWLGSDAVKVWLEDEPKDREAVQALLRVVAKEADRVGLPVIAHANVLETAKDALREGKASMLVHPVSATPIDDEFLELAKRNDVIYVTAMGYTQVLLAATSAAGPGRTKLNFPEQKIPLDCVDPVTRSKLDLIDALPAANQDLAGRRAFLKGDHQTHLNNLKRIHEAGITVAAGSDSGNLLLVHGPSLQLELEAMIDAGLSPMEVLVIATRNGAKAMGRLDEFGTLEVGKIADMVVLEKNPLEDISNVRSIDLVVRGGKVWTHKELKYDDEE